MTNIIISLFVAFIIHQELNFGYYVRKWTGTRISKPIKVLDCFPCFSFWIAAIISIFTQDYLTPLAVFLIIKFYDNK
jgi:hypothetical protein